MEPFDCEKHSAMALQLPFSFFSCIPYLVFASFVTTENGETFLCDLDPYHPGGFRSLFLPRTPENWVNRCVMFATQEQIAAVRAEGIEIREIRPFDTEYFYETASLANPTGRLGKRVRAFIRKFKPRVLSTYPKEEVLAFHQKWMNQKERDSYEVGQRFFMFCLNHIEALNFRALYVEIDGKLAGLMWNAEHPQGDGSVCLVGKADFTIPDLSRFLQYEGAKMFPNRPRYAFGTDVGDPGLRKFKQSLKPSLVVDYFNLETGTRFSKHNIYI